MHIRSWIIRGAGWIIAAVLILFFLAPIVNPTGIRLDEDGFDMLGGAGMVLVVAVFVVLALGQIQKIVYHSQLYRLLGIVMRDKNRLTIPMGDLANMTVKRYQGKYRIIVQEADKLDKKVFIVTSVTIDAHLRTLTGVSTPVLVDGMSGEMQIKSKKESFRPDIRREMIRLSDALLMAFLNS